MKIIDKLQENKIHISFEIFPPKTDAGIEAVLSATEQIAKLAPPSQRHLRRRNGGTSKNTVSDCLGYSKENGCDQPGASDLCFFDKRGSVVGGRPIKGGGD